MDESDVASLGRPPVLDDSAYEVLRAQEGIGLDLPPPMIIFTDSLSAKAVAESSGSQIECDTSDTSMFFVKSYISSGDIKLAYIKGPDLCTRHYDEALWCVNVCSRTSKWRGSSNIAKKCSAIHHFRPVSIGSGKRKLVPAEPATLLKALKTHQTWFKWSYYDPPGHNKSWGFGTPHTYLLSFEANWSLLRGGSSWVLRSTETLRTTDTTLVSVDGAIGQKGCSCTLAT
jgi:hypothetical protein